MFTQLKKRTAFLDGDRMTLVLSEPVARWWLLHWEIFKSETRNQGVTNLQEERRLQGAETSGETLFTSALALKPKGRLLLIYWAIDSKKRKKKKKYAVVCTALCSELYKKERPNVVGLYTPSEDTAPEEQPWKAFYFFLSCHLTITVLSCQG